MENVFFASSQFGNEYHTLGLIGNTALPYALHLAPESYLGFEKPHHRPHLKALREAGIYISPATFLGAVRFKVERFNCQPDAYQLFWRPIKKGKSKTIQVGDEGEEGDEEGSDGGPEKSGAKAKGGRSTNYPDEGWFKMIARGNTAAFYMTSEKPLEVPSYIRIGKFMSKCKVSQAEVKGQIMSGTRVRTSLIMRAEDIPASVEIFQFNKIKIQHGTYLANCEFKGDVLQIISSLVRDAYLPSQSAFYAAES